MTKPKTTPYDDLRATTRKIWLAGLGAIAEAEKRGEEVFQSLVKSGEKHEHLFTEPVEKAGGALRESMQTVSTKTSSGFRELEAAVDRQVAAAMKRVGLASRRELEALRKEVSRLREALEEKKPARTARTTRTTRKAATKAGKKARAARRR
jgi:poly(hydroxyalkanoate) granule-associated protein